MDKIRLKQIRQLNGFTLQEMADKVGSSKCYMWELENKCRNPSAILLYKIASTLRCSMEDLLGEPEIWGQYYPEPIKD